METAVKAAGWVVGKALAPVTGGLLEAWAASEGLGPNVEALKEELLYAQALLNSAQGREIHNPALKELLHKLRQMAYNADDVLDELEYFRIQDELDGTHHAADAHARGCVRGLALNARHTARAVAAKLKPSPGSRAEDDDQDNSAKQGCLSSVCSCGGRTGSSLPPSPTNQDDQKINGGCMQKLASITRTYACGVGNGREISSSQSSPANPFIKKVGCGCLLKVTSTSCNTAQSIGKLLPCCSFQSVDGNDKPFLCGGWRSKAQLRKNISQQESKLKFNRVEISEKMKDIIEHLELVCAKVSNVLNLEFMGTNRITKNDIAMKRPETTSYITENLFYGRESQEKKVCDIIKNFANNEGLAVLPIVGPGGIGKTTFTQHILAGSSSHFDITIWICVSLNFSASRLAKEAREKIPKVEGEKENNCDQDIIQQRLKAKRFLLVLDDMWECHEDEWKKLLAPFRTGETKGSMVIVTTRFHEVAKKVIMIIDRPIELERLEYKDFMHLFEACIFGDQEPWEGDMEVLHDVGKDIANKLKGFPLAAKTVGRLLRSQLTLEHWNRVLQSKEWEFQTGENDIMPALKVSYDYLPFHLQQCFYYCALFPEDYEFDRQELVCLWIGLNIVHPSDLNIQIEDVGERYLDGLVNHGFLKRNERNGGCPCYVVHDLLHNLAVNISSFECLTICSSNVNSIQNLQDVRHLSIIVDKKDVEDIKAFKYYKNYLSALDKRLKVEDLRTLMVFGEHHGSFVKTFSDLFEKARALRVIYLSEASYTLEDMAHKFSKLIHLRYLRIKTAGWENSHFNLSDMSRLYHLEVLDIQNCNGYSGCTRHMHNLAKLRHFLVSRYAPQHHSNIVEVGKLKLLQELRNFEVEKETKGFEVSQLGQLSELGGSLAICSLERIQTMEEAHEVRLLQLRCLKKLKLEWGVDRPKKENNVDEEKILEILIPHSNLQDLCIRGHGGSKCPQWLGGNLSVKILESLCLDDVAWELFPPLGELQLADGPFEEILNSMPDTKFRNLRRLEFIKLQRLATWVVDAPCQLFAHLKVLIIKKCPKLTKLTFPHSTCCHQEKEAKINWFTSLQELEIKDCPELHQFPPVPWSCVSCSAKIEGVGSGLEELYCGKNYKSEYSLEIVAKDAPDRMPWDMLAFHNLTELKELELKLKKCPPFPLHHFQMLSSLKKLKVGGSVSLDESEKPPNELMHTYQCGASAKELTRLLNCFPNLSELVLWYCDEIKGLDVVEQQSKLTPGPSPSSSANKVDEEVQDGLRQQEDAAGGQKEITPLVDDGVLLLPPQLQALEIRGCRELTLRFNPLDDNKEAARTGERGRGLRPLKSLRSLKIQDCPRFLSAYSSFSSPSCSPFPTSLEELVLEEAGGMQALHLSSLTSLTKLIIKGCGDCRAEGLQALLAQGNLTTLDVSDTSNFFAGSEPTLPLEPSGIPRVSSSKLWLFTDDAAGFLAAPVCTVLYSSLPKLDFWSDNVVELFTKGQEEALQRFTSLEWIRFSHCNKLQCIPTGLRRLPNLKRFEIYDCESIRSLPKDGLPGSLQELEMDGCPGIRSLPKDFLPSSLQKLVIRNCKAVRYLPKDGLPSSLEELVIQNCPAMQSLPKVDSLPSSLRVLDVRYNESEELRRQCRKLIGTIAIVKA